MALMWDSFRTTAVAPTMHNYAPGNAAEQPWRCGASNMMGCLEEPRDPGRRGCRSSVFLGLRHPLSKRVSTRGPGKVTAAEDVDVQMGNALTSRFGVVDDDSIAAFGDVHLVGNLGCRIKQVSQQGHV